MDLTSRLYLPSHSTHGSSLPGPVSKRVRPNPVKQNHNLYDSSVLSSVLPSVPLPVLSPSLFNSYASSPFSFIDSVIADPFTDSFVYLTARGPYDLLIVDHASISVSGTREKNRDKEVGKEDYYTMSRAGVTHFWKGETEFTRLDQWEREYYLYTKIMEVGFFKKFKVWKAFYFWKKDIRRGKAKECDSVLNTQLFLLRPSLCKPLLALRSHCVDVFHWSLHRFDAKVTFTLDHFVSTQEQVRQKVAMQLEALNAHVKSFVLNACEDDLNLFLVKSGFRDKISQKISHAERAAHRTECRKLTKYIRLADYLVIDSLISLAMDRTTEVLKFLVEASRPLFSIELLLESGENHLTFQPAQDSFQNAMEQSIRESVGVLMSTNRLLVDEEFHPYTQVNVDEVNVDPDIESKVLQDENFLSTLDKIKKGLADAFDQAYAYAQSFEKYKEMYLVDIATKIDDFITAPASLFSILIQRFKREIAEMESIPIVADVGIIQVNSAKLKVMLLPAPKRCLADIELLLPKIANQKTNEMVTTLKFANEKISAIPYNVDQFVEFMAFLHQLTENQQNMEDQFQAIADLYNLMAEHHIGDSENDKMNFERLVAHRATMHTSIQLSESSVGDNTTRFSKDLETEIPRLKKKIVVIQTKLANEQFASFDSNQDEMIQILDDLEEEMREIEKSAHKFQHYQEVLQLEMEPFDELSVVSEDLSVKLTLWSALKDWEFLTQKWMIDLFDEIKSDAIAAEIQKYNKIVLKSFKALGLEHLIVLTLRAKVDKFNKAVPIVMDLKNPSLEQRHWDEITELIEYSIKDNTDTTLGILIDLNIMQHQDTIASIASKAVQEGELRKMLHKIEREWKELALVVNHYKEQKEVFVLGGLDDIIAKLDESLVTINIIIGSRYVEPIRADVTEWNRRLILFQETLDEWTMCQKNWIYLESIFSAPDIQKQLPDESSLFTQIDRSWKELMKRTNENPLISSKWNSFPATRDALMSHNVTLDKLQKRLEDYLETKRAAFPRFYFLSNDELLEILAQTKNVQAVQRHLRKCFDNIVKLDFGDDPKVTDMIYAMISSEDEKVPLPKNLKARGSIELWLSKVEAGMIENLRKFMKAGVVEYDKMPRKQWILEKFAQIVMTVSQIIWCRGSEEALKSAKPKEAMRKWLAFQKTQLSDCSKLVAGSLSSINRKKLVTLITTDVHARDVTQTLIQKGVDSINDFEWQQQLRFYWITEQNGDEDCVVRQANAVNKYGYEYMGVTTRLVITPLTDKCWMTITGAFHLKLGASPAGPAGTGKTESVKDLAKALGIQCIVFNCSDQVEPRMMGKLFSGLCQAGAWACLDEFNRIDIEVLSVIAMQLMQIREANLQLLDHFIFDDRDIPLKPTCGVCITMNPGYAGRTELPDNLKVLFRPVAMMIPDYALIAEIMLFAEGFENAQVLSKKMVKLYKLSSEQLSQQDHYDFGMRAVKSVLVMAGSMKRAEPDLNEDIVLIRALRDSNVPKFLTDDLPLFSAIIQDLFPGVTIPSLDYGELSVAIKQCCLESNIQATDPFVTKVIQLYDTFCVRFGAMVVGPAGGGKSTCYTILQKAMTMLRAAKSKNDNFQLVQTHILNPKAIKMAEMYGEINSLTQEWTDGLASTIMREALLDTSQVRHWIVFDGPVDALWIENMNTVLDDNMTLCLSNGERIKLKQEMRMLFEVMDLAVASPATVSRCGMVYITPLSYGWKLYMQSWLKTLLVDQLSQAHRDQLTNLFDEKFAPSLVWRAKECKDIIAVPDITIATSLCKLFEALFQPAAVKFSTATSEEITSLVNLTFIFSFVWAVGGSLDANSAIKFNSYLTTLFETNRPSGAFIDYYVDFETRQWRPWEELVPAFEFEPSTSYFDLLVPTINTVRYSILAESLLSIGRSVFYTGMTGVGKSVVATDLFRRSVDTRGFVPLFLTFSAQTNAKRTQDQIESALVKKKRTLLGAPANKKVIVFVDDVNMPSVEQYGAMPPIELLRQFQDYKGFYDRKKLFWKDIADTTLMCCASPPGGGRNELTPRFTRHFHVLCVPQPSDAVMQKIFGSIVKGFFAPFKKDQQELADPIVKSTIQLYNAIAVELLPTPAKSHYTFNLRDVSKVFQGILNVRPHICTTVESLARLWIHESARCFHDRLVNDADKEWFQNRVVKLLLSNFGISWSVDDLFKKQPILFGDFFGRGEKVYEESKDIASLTHVLNDCLEEYNMASSHHMKLVFFEDAISHILRIVRVISQPRGNAMLVGVGGSGKQSYTRFASSIAGYSLYQLEIVKGYNYDSFREDMKKMMRMSGVTGTQVVFFFPDNVIIDERFLEDINNVLNAGEVPNLLESDEKQKIIDDLALVARQKNLPDTPDQLYKWFVSRVRENLHIVLAMSPVGDNFRIRCRKFPSLINCTTIDWYNKWPKAALLSVSSRFLAELELPSQEIRTALSEMCVDIHVSMDEMSEKFFQSLRRHVYSTPKSYLDLIKLYTETLQKRRDVLGENRRRLQNGLLKLRETNQIVAELQEKVKEFQPKVIQKAADAEVMLKRVAVDQETADQTRVEVEKEESLIAVDAAVVREAQGEAEKDLAQALPALQNAQQAVAGLEKKDISEMKALPNPPVGVRKTMEIICIMFKEKPDWDSAKKMLSDNGFLKRLQDYNQSDIFGLLKKMQPILTDETFTEEAMLKINKAAASLCKWVHAMVTYAKISREIEPKQKKLAEMTAMLNEKEAILKEKQDALAAVVQKVADLKKTLDETVNEKIYWQDQMETCKAQLMRASKLTVGLADEEIRWARDAEALGIQIDNLVGDVFLSSACISYFGPFTGEYRSALVDRWVKGCREKKIPVSGDAFSLVSVLGDPVQVREWNISGLPTDNVSTDSAIIREFAQRWPLFIDPQGQAKRWIRNDFKNRLVVTRFSDSNLLQVLRNAVSNGLPVLIEDIGESLDPSIEPVLLKSFFMQGKMKAIRLGDSDCLYSDNFRLFLSTKMPNPHYTPEISIKVTIINFTVTIKGLEDQLLGDVVRKEKPEIEEKKGKLVSNMAKDKKQLKGLEERILQTLSESAGSVLDNEELINTLDDSKRTSNVINERVKEAEQTEIDINIAREKFRPAACRGSIIYFVIADLAFIDSMYQFSLQYFSRLFNLCIDTAPAASDLENRIENIMKNVTSVIYFNVCRGLFESHKLIYSFLIATSIQRNQGLITEVEWNIYLRGAPLAPLEQEKPNPSTNIFSPQNWKLLQFMENSVPSFHGITADITKELASWEKVAKSVEPHRAIFPGIWANSLSPFQKMMLLKTMREEKLLFASLDYVGIALGNEFKEPKATTLEDVYKDTDRKTPIVFILSTGADPTSILFRFAADMKYRERLRIISLGQGMGPKAARIIEQASRAGDWVLLQNTHLAKSWLPELEKIITEFQDTDKGDQIHENFRLWLTSMPVDYFPVTILQNGVKLTNEPPKGLKANLKRTFAPIEDSTFESCSKPRAWKKLIFGLSFFHAVLQERRKFGPLGFNIRYEFNDSDLETSTQVLRMFLEEQSQIPWDALRFLCGQINYGGRVTDDWDRRCLGAILGQYFSEKILEDQYVFSSSGVYHAPLEGTLHDVRQYIDGLPSTDPPEIFGMHENADITFQRQETDIILITTLSIQPRTVESSSGKSNDDIVSESIARIEEIIPADLNKELARSQSESSEVLDSLTIVLLQETDRFNRLLQVIRRSLKNLKSAIRGEVVMSQELDFTYSSLLNNTVPTVWSKVAYPSLKPLASWVVDLVERVNFMRVWSEQGRPKSFWMSGFFFPQGFMTGALQTHSRKYKIPIDVLNFEFKVLSNVYKPEQVEGAPDDGIYIYGLFLDGGRWNDDTQMLQDANVGQLYSEMPMVHFIPTTSTERNELNYECPVYKTSVRAGVLSTTGQSTNFILAVDLPTDKLASHWILVGLALLCQLNS